MCRSNFTDSWKTGGNDGFHPDKNECAFYVDTREPQHLSLINRVLQKHVDPRFLYTGEGYGYRIITKSLKI